MPFILPIEKSIKSITQLVQTVEYYYRNELLSTSNCYLNYILQLLLALNLQLFLSLNLFL